MEDDKENMVSCSPDSGVCCDLEARPASQAGYRLDPMLCNRRLTLLKSLSQDSEYSLDTSLFDAEEFLQDMGFAGTSDPTIPDRFLPSLMQRLSRFPEAEMESLHDRIIQSIGCFKRKEGKRRLFRNLSMGKDSRADHYGKNLLICPTKNYPLLRSNTGPAAFPFEEGAPVTLKGPPRLNTTDSGHGSLDPAGDERSIPESPIAILVSAASTEQDGSQFDSRQTSLDETSDTEDSVNNDFSDNSANQDGEFADTIEELQKLTEQLSDSEDLQSGLQLVEEDGAEYLGCGLGSDVVQDCSRLDGTKPSLDVASVPNSPETQSAMNNRMSPVVAHNSSETPSNDGKSPVVLKHPLRRTSNANRYDFKTSDQFESLAQQSDLNPDCLLIAASEVVESEPGNLPPLLNRQALDDGSNEKSKGDSEESNSDLDSESVCNVFQFDRTQSDSRFFSNPKHTRDDSLTNFLSSMLDTTDKSSDLNASTTDLQALETQSKTDVDDVFHRNISSSASFKDSTQGVVKAPNRKRVLKRMSSSMQCCEDEDCKHHDGLNPNAVQKDVEKDAIHPLTDPFASIDRRPKVALRITNSAPLSSDYRYMHPCGTLYQKSPYNAFKGNSQNSGKNSSNEAYRRKERRPCKRRRYLSCPSPQNFNFVPNFQGREISASMRDLHSMGYEYPANDSYRQWCSCCEMASFSDSSADRSLRYHQSRRVTSCLHASPRERSPVRSCFRNSGGFPTLDPFPPAFASRRSLFPSRLNSTLPKYYLCNSSPDIRCVSPELVRTHSARNQFQPLSRQCHQFAQFGGPPPPMDDVFIPNVSSSCCPFHCSSLRPGDRNVPRYPQRQNSISYADSEAPFSNYNLVTNNSRYCSPKRSGMACKHSFPGQFSSDRLPQHQSNISHSDSEVPFLSNVSLTKNGRYTVPKGSVVAGMSPPTEQFSSEIFSDRFPQQNNIFYADSEPPLDDVPVTKNGRCCVAPKRSDMTCKSPVSEQYSLDRLPQRQNSMSYEEYEAPFPNNISVNKNSHYYSVTKVSDVDCRCPKSSGISGRFPSDSHPQHQNGLSCAYSEAPFQNDVSVTKNDPSNISDMVCKRPNSSGISGQLLSDSLPQCQKNISYADPEAPVANKLVTNKDHSYITPKGSDMACRRLSSSRISGQFSSDRLPQRQDSISYADFEAPFVEKNPVTTGSRYRSHMTRKHPNPSRISGQFPSDDHQQLQDSLSYADFEVPLLDKISSTKENRNCPPINRSNMTCKQPNSSGQFPSDDLQQLQNNMSCDDFEAPLLNKISTTKDSRNCPPINGSDMIRKHPKSSSISGQFPPDRLPQRQDSISYANFEAPLLDKILVSKDSRNCPPTEETALTSKRPNSYEVSSDSFVSPRPTVDQDYPPSSPTNKREALLEKKIRIFSKFLANLGNLSKSIPDNEQKGKRATTRSRKLSCAASLPDKKAYAPPPTDGAWRCTTPPPRLLDCRPSTKEVMNPASVQESGSPVYENRVLLQASGDAQKHSFQPVMFTSSVSMYISGGDSGDGSKENSEENVEPCRRNDFRSQSSASQMPFNVVSKELEDLQLSIQKAKEMRLCASKELQLLQALLSGDEPHKEKRFETSSSIDTPSEKEFSSLKKSETLTDLRERMKKRDESEEASFWLEEIKRVKKETEESWKTKLDRMEARLESQEEELRRLQSDNDNLQKSLESQTLGSPVCHCKSDGLQNGFGRIDSAFEDDEEYLSHKPSIPIQSTRQECDRLQERLMEEEQRADQLNILLNQKLIEHNKLQITLSKQTKEMIELEKSYLQLQCRLKRGHKPVLPRLCSRDSPFASKNLCPGPSPPASPHP